MTTGMITSARRKRLWRAVDHGYVPVDVLNRKGRLLFQLGRFDRARQLYERAICQLRPLGDTPVLGEFIYQLCCTLYSTGGYDDCEPLLDEAQRAFLAADDHGGQARVLGLRGNIAWDRGRLEEAMRLYRDKLDIARRIDDTEGIVGTLGNLGGVHFTRGDREQAMRYLQEQLDLAAAHDLQADLCIALGNFALMLTAARDFPAALEYCRRQQTLAARMGDKVGLGYAMDNMGHIRNGLGDAAGS
ncbi:tetratricopeptide repeat protein, partial [bacterium]|nr:tetratricopeptide repeat protein [bacterium]